MKANDDANRAFPIADIDAALRRAALRAREVAKHTHTPVVIWQHGRIVEMEDQAKGQRAKEGNQPESEY